MVRAAAYLIKVTISAAPALNQPQHFNAAALAPRAKSNTSYQANTSEEGVMKRRRVHHTPTPSSVDDNVSNSWSRKQTYLMDFRDIIQLRWHSDPHQRASPCLTHQRITPIRG